MGAGFGDIDNDGYLDLYLGMGNPSLGSLTPARAAARATPSKRFTDITTSSGTGELHKGHGVAFADLFRNGQTEIVAQIVGAIPVRQARPVRVYQNPGNTNNWINLPPRRCQSNRSRHRHKVEAQRSSNNGRKLITIDLAHRRRNQLLRRQPPRASHRPRQPAARIISVDVYWPTTNSRQHFTGMPTNQFLQIKEFDTTFTKLDRKAILRPVGRRVASQFVNIDDVFGVPHPPSLLCICGSWRPQDADRRSPRSVMSAIERKRSSSWGTKIARGGR